MNLRFKALSACHLRPCLHRISTVWSSTWRHRASRWLHWNPSTCGQVWFGAVLGFGVPGFVIWSVLGMHRYWPLPALMYGASITLFGGLGQSYRLRRRRQHQADLKNLYAAALAHHEPQ